GRKSVLERARYLLAEGRLELLRILRRIYRQGVEDAAAVDRAHLHLRGDAVAQPLLLADAHGKARIEKAAAEHVVAEHERRIVRIVVAQIQVKPGDEECIGLVRRLD